MEQQRERWIEAQAHVHNTLRVSDETVRRLHDRVMSALPRAEEKPERKNWLTASLATAAVAALAVAAGPYLVHNLPIGSHVVDPPDPNSQTGPNPKIQVLESEPKPFFQDKSDDEKLLMMNHIPLHLTYEELKEKVPEVGELQPEGGMEGRVDKLTEAFAYTRIFDIDAKVEFKFNDNHLYAYRIMLEKLDQPTADALYLRLKEFYAKEFGIAGKEEKVAENASQSRSTVSWKQDRFSVSITNNRNFDGLHYLSWGIQIDE